jgi:REP element-mobilizing transposase RayT
MSHFIHKEHNVPVLLYHIVCPTKYRRAVFSEQVDAKLKEVCQEIEARREMEFLEIGTDRDHVHFLVQSVPNYSPKKIVQRIKRITAREIFKACPEVKRYLWGGELRERRILYQHGGSAWEGAKDSELCSATRTSGRKRTTEVVLLPRSLLRGSLFKLLALHCFPCSL